ncbi:MAG: DoxX family membrane protein [Chloroflexota bacterium]|nr:DoxX family membrane protein [Chloroflexota bacterium]
MSSFIPPRDRLLPITALAIARISMGLLWLTNQSWKAPPDFRCASPPDYLHNGTGRGLAWWMNEMVEHSIFPPHAWFVREVALPNCQAFGWVTLLIEGGAGVLLVLGLFTRLGALLGLIQSINLFFGLAYAPNEWVWSYAMMAIIHLVLLATAAGRAFGLDAFLHERFRRRAMNNDASPAVRAGAVAT